MVLGLDRGSVLGDYLSDTPGVDVRPGLGDALRGAGLSLMQASPVPPTLGHLRIAPRKLSASLPLSDSASLKESPHNGFTHNRLHHRRRRASPSRSCLRHRQRHSSISPGHASSSSPHPAAGFRSPTRPGDLQAPGPGRPRRSTRHRRSRPPGLHAETSAARSDIRNAAIPNPPPPHHQSRPARPQPPSITPLTVFLSWGRTSTPPSRPSHVIRGTAGAHNTAPRPGIPCRQGAPARRQPARSRLAHPRARGNRRRPPSIGNASRAGRLHRRIVDRVVSLSNGDYESTNRRIWPTTSSSTRLHGHRRRGPAAAELPWPSLIADQLGGMVTCPEALIAASGLARSAVPLAAGETGRAVLTGCRSLPWRMLPSCRDRSFVPWAGTEHRPGACFVAARCQHSCAGPAAGVRSVHSPGTSVDHHHGPADR